MSLILPFPPKENFETQDADIYARFMRHLGYVPNSRIEIKILSSLQFTADILGFSDAHISKTLVDLGLRASGEAFPAEFLRFVRRSLARQDCDVGGPSLGVLALEHFWKKEGGGPCAGVVSFDRNGVSSLFSA